MNYGEFDKNNIWHPFTQEATAKQNINIIKGKNAYLWDENGKKYVDLVSSWWTNCHGHCNSKINQAITKQIKELEHVIFANFTHKPAVELVDNLKAYIDPKLSRYFFSDNGSTAVEIAIKMTYQGWKNKGINDRNIFVTLEGNYHGDTFGAMSLGRSCGLYEPFKDLLFEVKYLPFPETWFNDNNIEKKENDIIINTNEFLKNNHKNVCAFFLESLVQGCSGMRMIRPEFVNKICKLFINYNIPIIFDEVMTGFGRTGTMFAYQQTEIIPDIICLSKALTGGYLPMALTITSNDIYNNFYSATDNNKTFLHGHSYTANPIACAAALASIKLFNENNIIEKIKKIENIHKNELKKLEKYSYLEHFRVMGLIAAFEIKNKNGYNSTFSNNLKYKFFENGLLLRPLGNTIYLLPPYCISENELKNCYKKIINIINNYLNI